MVMVHLFSPISQTVHYKNTMFTIYKFKYLLKNFEDVITEIVMQYNSLVFLEHEAKFPITF